jgi:preprotein translocase subunit SecA
MSDAALRGWGVVGRAAGPYAERSDPEPNWLDRIVDAAWGWLRPKVAFDAARLSRIVGAVDAAAAGLEAAGDDEILQAARALAPRLAREGFTQELAARAFALVREQAHRRLGQRHHPVQLVGGWAMLRGMLAEMETGEGKTLTATLPAVTAALAGLPVHVVTVNGYLARRDAQALAPLYEAFGLSVGLVDERDPPAARRQAYACDVVYATNKDLVFDYLRDRLALGRVRSRARLNLGRLAGAGRGDEPALLLRGLHFAIVDEADSVMIDEARTPLIISAGEADSDAQLYADALRIAGSMREAEHYRIERETSRVRLTGEGRAWLAAQCAGLAGAWRSARGREELAVQALTALHVYRRDRHYIVVDGKVQIVDEFTGRTMPDRSWERGLHQLIEAKEDVELTGQRRTIARLTYQRFFRRYLGLAGMTGTASEVAGELWAVYGLRVARVPTNRPVRRAIAGAHTFVAADARWRAVAESVERVVSQGRPVLVGTRSVEASERLGALLDARGIAHQLLNARQDRDEAEQIARAGQPGQVTVATNMAGRGTDIQLAPGVAGRGGLHVILTEYHESARIDRQLFGRCGRQGDPGSCEALVSLQDALFETNAARSAAALARAFGARGEVPRWLAAALRRFAQFEAERRNSAVRRQTVRADRDSERALAFAGRGE